MRRISVALCLIASTAACVNLGKPENVAECANNNTCINTAKLDGAPVNPGVDSGAKRDVPDAKPTDADAAVAPIPDGATTINDAPLAPDDTPPILGDDTGPVLPDAPDDPAGTTFQETGPGQPDLPPGVGPDTPADVPADTRDAAVGTPDAPPDTPPDIPPDTKDAYRDVAVGICAPGGVIQPAGTVCRAAVGLCDVDETCDGVHADCPADVLAVAGTSCRASAGDCDVAETCTGTGPNCPVDGFKQAGAQCRAAAGLCDVAESCTGTGATCPLDALAPSGTVCRASTDSNKCDPAETCTGSSVSCPADVIYTTPGVPGGVTATAGTLQATIAWSAATGASGYNVKRSGTTGSGYTTLGSVVPTTSASPYNDTGLTGGTPYYYVVSAINTIATCESTNSAEKSATPAGVCTPPAAPTIAATPGNGSITISWTAVAGLTYSVSRKISTGTADYAPIASGISTGSYPDSSVVYGTSYTYVVTASNGTCSSVNSNTVTSSPLCSPPATTPTGLAASTPSLGGQVTLTWTGTADATTYQILRKLSTDASYVQVGQVVGGTGTKTYPDSGLTNGLAYNYVVTSNNGTCASATSAVVTATPQCVVSAPVFVTPASVGDKEVDLTWSAPAGAINYTLSRKLGTAATYGVITTPAITATSYADKDATLINDTAYNYVVTASNGNCSSANSTAISATPHCTPPNVPGTLTATPGDSKVNLSWVASNPTPTTYTVQRKTGSGGTYADLYTTPNGTTTTYVDSTAANTTTYFYQVRSNKGSCSSGYDTAVSATPVAACTQGAPGTPTATITPSTQVALSWTASNPVPTTNYTIGRSTSATGTYSNLGSGVTTTSYTDSDTTLIINSTYYYQITANGSCSATSAPGSVTLTCSTPGVPSPSAALQSNGSITVSWAATTGATAYTVYRSTDGTTYSAIAGATNQTALNYNDTGVTNGNVYYYKVSGSNANHQCASAQSSATTALRSCTYPTVPTGLSAKRAGNKQVALVWTNSPGTNNYSVQRSTTSGSGYAQVGTTAGTSFTDPVPSNTVAYYYVVTARSDAGGNCSSGNSAQVSVPACTEFTNSGSAQKQNDNTEWCLVTCDDVAWWGDSGLGDRALYINTAGPTASGALPLPAKGNSGYAFYFTASANGTGNFTFWNYGASATHTCP